MEVAVSCTGAHPDSPEIPHSRSSRPTYSRSQVEAYLGAIGLPQRHRCSPIFDRPALAREEQHGLPLLAALMRFHLAAIPFENLALHYSPQRHATLDADELLARAATSGSHRGGHCLQMNALLGQVLRSLGFQVMSSAARVNTACQAAAHDPGYAGPSFNSWDHMINLVRFGARRYLVDVGMNARGPTVPVPVEEGAEVVSLPPRSMRLIRGCIAEAESCSAAHALWQLEMRPALGAPWVPTYAFADVEFIPRDFEMINWFVTTHPQSWFTHQLVVGKMLLDGRGEEVVGNITLAQGTVRKRMRGEVEWEFVCGSERDRVDVLASCFGIQLSALEQDAIRGTMSAIP